MKNKMNWIILGATAGYAAVSIVKIYKTYKTEAKKRKEYEDETVLMLAAIHMAGDRVIEKIHNGDYGWNGKIALPQMFNDLEFYTIVAREGE